MSFVHVVDIFFNTQFVEQQNAAYAEQELLLHAVFPVTAIQLMSDGSVIFAVTFEVGVHQKQVDASYGYFPYVRVDDAVVKRHFQNQRLAVFVVHLADRQIAEVLRFVVGDLLSVHRKALGEITVAV